MIQFVLLLFLATGWIWGVKCLFSTGHLLEPAGDWIENNFPQWFYKPTIGCQACMSSFHGTLWYWLIGPFVLPSIGVSPLVGWVLFCICLCGINFILLELIYSDEE